MTVCDHRRLDDPTGLACVRDHDDRGHVYHSSDGSSADDKHKEGGHG